MSGVRREISGAQGGDGGVGWIRLALWAWLLSSVASATMLGLALQIEHTIVPEALPLFRVVPLACHLAALFGAVAMALGLVQLGRSARVRGLSAIAGLTTVGVAVWTAAAAIEVYAKVHPTWFAFHFSELSWSRLIQATSWPVTMTGVVAALCRVRRLPARRAALFITCAAVIGVVQAGLHWIGFSSARSATSTSAAAAIDRGLAIALLASALAAAGSGQRTGAAGAAPLSSRGWSRAASGLSLAGTTMVARLVCGLLLGAMMLLLSAPRSHLGSVVLVMAGLLTGIPILVATLAALWRTAAAPEPAAARSAAGAALILLAIALFLGCYAVTLRRELLRGDPPALGIDEILTFIVVADLLEVAGLAALLRGIGALATRVGARDAARGAAGLAAALIVILGAGALARYNYGLYAGTAAGIIVLLTSIGTLVVVARFRVLARQVGTAVRQAADAPALARAVALVRDEQ